MAKIKTFALMDEHNVVLEVTKAKTMREAALEVLERVYKVRLINITKNKSLENKERG